MFKCTVQEYIAPLFKKPTDEFTFNCPLHYFVIPTFKKILKLNGFELVHSEDLFQNKSSGDFINIVREVNSYTLEIDTTLKISELESLFFSAFKEEFKNKYLLVQGSTLKIKDSLDGSDYEEKKKRNSL